jgi:glycosyltransferase involved in cell wall biosynthesis
VRVLVVNDLPLDAGWGGETHVRRLVAALRAAGDDVDVFAGEVAHRGVGKVRDLWDPVARRRLAARARRFAPDVVHHHNVVRELSVSVLGVPRRTPSVMTVHDHRLVGAADYPRRTPRGVADRLLKAPLDRAVARRRLAAAIAVSEPLAERLRARGFRDVTHVPVCGLMPTAPLQPVAANRDVAFVGRLSADKGVRVLTDAFATVAADRPDARLLVAGAGPDESAVRDLADRLGPDRVRHLGRLDESGISALLAGVRVVVVPSLPAVRPEGSSLSAVEAALHGRAVVGSDDPAVAEVLRTLAAGDPIPAGDDRALATALARLLDDDAAATAAGDVARRNAERVYAPGAVADRVRAVHDRVAAEAAR